MSLAKSDIPKLKIRRTEGTTGVVFPLNWRSDFYKRKTDVGNGYFLLKLLLLLHQVDQVWHSQSTSTKHMTEVSHDSIKTK